MGKKYDKQKRSKYWCWTINLQDDVSDQQATEQSRDLHRRLSTQEDIQYSVFQLERGNNGDRLHMQGYVEFKTRIRLSQVKDRLGTKRVHVELRLGSAKQASDYCTKQDTRVDGPWSFGDQSETRKGKRNDLNEIRDAIKGGKSELDLADSYFASWCRYNKSFSRYRGMVTPQREKKTISIVLYGPTGTGKSRYAWEWTTRECVYSVPRSTGDAIWFDGYDPSVHNTVIFDDFYGWIRLNVLLQLIDRYPMRVPTKGGFVTWNPQYAFFTSNVEWQQWYGWDGMRGGQELKAALERRLDIVHHFIQSTIDSLVVTSKLNALKDSQ